MAQVDAENWQAEARREQCEFYSVWGHKVVWRGVPLEQKQSLQLMIALHLLQKTADDENHTVADMDMTRQERATVNVVANKMIKYFADQFVHVKVVYISCHWRGQMTGEIVFRVDGGALTKYIDSRFRVYDDWQSFLKGNTLPPNQICFPTNGVYTLAPSGMEVLVSFDSSPASSKKNRILEKAKLIAYLFLFIGLILEIVFAFLPDVAALMIVGFVLCIMAFMVHIPLAVIKFLDALKYS